MFRPGLLLAACLLLTPAYSAEPAIPAPASPLDSEWQKPVDRFRDFVVALAAGEMEAAWQQYRIMLFQPPKSSQSPFEPDPYEQFLKKIGRFPPGLSSLQLVGERRLTEKARKFTLIGDSDAGPIALEILIYRARNDWFFGNFSYQLIAAADANWFHQHDDLFPATRYAQPLSLALPDSTPSIEAGGE